jgi:hypothetical protein
LGIKPTGIANTGGLKPLSRGPKAPRPERARDFGALLRSAQGGPGRPDPPGTKGPPTAPPPAKVVAQASPELFDRPAEPRFAHQMDPADLKAVRLGVKATAAETGLEVEAVVLDQAGRPVPDAVVLALVNPSGGPGAPSAEAGFFLPNTDPFGRTRQTLRLGGPARVKLIAVMGNGLQTARELDLPTSAGT